MTVQDTITRADTRRRIARAELAEVMHHITRRETNPFLTADQKDTLRRFMKVSHRIKETVSYLDIERQARTGWALLDQLNPLKKAES